MPSRLGSPNKNKQALIALLQSKYPGYQPVMEMAEAAIRLSEKANEARSQVSEARLLNDENLAVLSASEADLWKEVCTAHDKVAQYVTPKLKAVELSGNNEAPVTYILKWADERNNDTL